MKQYDCYIEVYRSYYSDDILQIQWHKPMTLEDFADYSTIAVFKVKLKK